MDPTSMGETKATSKTFSSRKSTKVSLRSVRSANNGIEGVLFELSLALQKPPHYPKLGLLSRLLLQLNAVYIVVNDKFPWTGTMTRVLEIINFPILAVKDLDFTAFTIIWCLLVALILGCIGFTRYAQLRLAKGQIVAAPWMMRVVRAVFGLFSAVPVGLFAVILGYASCDYGQFNVIPGKNLFFGYECANGSIDKIIGFCASIVAAAFFVGIGLAEGLIYPSDPQSLSIFRRAHAKLESATILSQFALYIAFLLLPHYAKVFGVAYLLIQIALFVGWVVFQPLYVNIIQDLQVGLAALPCWAGICFLGLIGGSSLYNVDSSDNTSNSDNVSRALSILLVAGAVPVMFGGYVLSGVMRKKIPRVARKLLMGVRDDEAAFNTAIRMYDGTEATGVSDGMKAALIEVAARSLLGVRDVNIDAACSVLRRGIIRFPQSVYLRLQYCKYLIRAKTMAEQATHMVQTCEMLRLSTDQTLALNLFRKEAAAQLRASKQRFGGGGSEGFDEAELKQRLSDAKVLYIKCTQLVSEAWAELQKDSQRRDKAAAKTQRAATAVAKFLDGEGEGKKHRKARRKASSSKAKQNKLDEGSTPIEPFSDDASDNGRGISKVGVHAENEVRHSSVSNLQMEWIPAKLSPSSTKEQLAGRSIHSILTVLEKLREMESKADAAFEFLMEKCPESPEVLHEYAAYVRAVKFDEKGAKNLESRRDMAIVTKESAAKGERLKNNDHSKTAVGDEEDDSSTDEDKSSSSDDHDGGYQGGLKKLEIQSERISFSPHPRPAPASLTSPSNKSSKSADVSGNTSDEDGYNSRRLSRQKSMLKNMDSDSEQQTMQGRNSFDDHHSRGSSESSGNQFESAEKNIAKEKAELAMIVRSSASKLVLQLRIFTLLLLLLSTAMFLVFVQMEADAVTATTDTDFSGFRRFDCSQFAYHTRNMQLAAIRGKTATFEEARSFIISSAKDFSDIHSTLSQVRKIYSPRLRSFYDTPSVNIREAVQIDGNGNPVISEGLVTGSQAADKLILAALNVAYSNASGFINYDPRNPTTFPAFFFVIDNAMTVFQAMDSATILTVLEVDRIVFLCMVIVGVLCAVAALVEGYIIVAMFRPAVSNLFEQLGKTVDELSKIDRTERSTMASRFRAMKEQAESQWNQSNGKEENGDNLNDKKNNDHMDEIITPVEDFLSAPPSPASSTLKIPLEVTSPSVILSGNIRQHYHDKSLAHVGSGVRFEDIASPITHSQRSNRRRPTLVEGFDESSKTSPMQTCSIDAGDEDDEPGTVRVPVSRSSSGRIVDEMATIEVSSAMNSLSSLSRNKNGGHVVDNLLHSSDEDEEEPKSIVITLKTKKKNRPPPSVVIPQDKMNTRVGIVTKKSILVSNNQEIVPEGNELSDDDDCEDYVDGVGKQKKTAMKSSRFSFFKSKNIATNKKKGDILSHLTKSSLERKDNLERWYILCCSLVVLALVIVFALGYTSTDNMKVIARSMNNVCRRRDVARSATWLTLELLNVNDPRTSLAGGPQQITTSEDSIRCHLQEMISAILQIHEGNLDGVDGWNRAKARNKVQNDWNTPCTVFTDQEDLYNVAAELGSGAVRSDDRMNAFMFQKGQCLAAPGDLAGISSLMSNSRTAPLLAKFSSSKCLYFNQGEGLMSLGLNTIFDELMLVYKNIAFGPAKSTAGVAPISEFYDFICTWAMDTSEYGEPSEEWGLGLRKGAMLMEAAVFDAQSRNFTVLIACYVMLIVISLIQLLWLGSRVHHVIQDNSYIYILVRRMLKIAAKEKAAGVKSEQFAQQQQQTSPRKVSIGGWM